MGIMDFRQLIRQLTEIACVGNPFQPVTHRVMAVKNLCLRDQMKIGPLFFIENYFYAVEEFISGLTDLSFPVNAFGNAADLPELPGKAGHNQRTGAERNGFDDERFGFMDAHEKDLSFLLPDAGKNLLLFAVHLGVGRAAFVFIAEQVKNPVTETVMKLVLKGVAVFGRLGPDGRKTKRDISEEINPRFLRRSGRPPLTERQNVGCPGMPEIARIQNLHAGISYQEDAQDGFLEPQIPENF